jgi:hypothetical protein
MHGLRGWSTVNDDINLHTYYFGFLNGKSNDIEYGLLST